MTALRIRSAAQILTRFRMKLTSCSHPLSDVVFPNRIFPIPMTNSMFDKTDKGREEIATRKHQLASRLRTLLVLVDGKHTVDDLLKKIGGLGLDEQSISELQRDGFIHDDPQNIVDSMKSGSPDTSGLISEPSASTDFLPEGETQFEAIYHFYNETIKSTVGLRGYALQLKVERCNSIEDFRQLRKSYLEAVLKAKGNEMARSLRDRLDQLLYLGETIPPPSTIMGGEPHPE